MEKSFDPYYFFIVLTFLLLPYFIDDSNAVDKFQMNDFLE